MIYSSNNITYTIKEMDFIKLSRIELLRKCEELGITKCKSKNKTTLISLIIEKLNAKDNYYNLNTIDKNELSDDKFVIISNKKNKNKLNVIDLFCGCGGMSKGLTDAGLNIIAGIDIWDVAINSYKKNILYVILISVCNRQVWLFLKL